MIDMDRAAVAKIVLGIAAALSCGALMAEKPGFVLGGNLNGAQNAPEARRTTGAAALPNPILS